MYKFAGNPTPHENWRRCLAPFRGVLWTVFWEGIFFYILVLCLLFLAPKSLRVFFSLALTQKMSRVLAFSGWFFGPPIPQGYRCSDFPDAKVVLTTHPKGAKGWAQELSSTDASGPLASVRLFLDAFQQFWGKTRKGCFQ